MKEARAVISIAGLIAMLLAIPPAVAGDGSAETPYTTLPYSPSLDPSSMDRSVDPCEDLYTFSCGNWQKHNPIPADQSSWSVYDKLYVDNQRFLWGILEQAADPQRKHTPGEQQIGDYFAACMDEQAVERAGIDPLRAELSQIESLNEKRSLATLIAALHARGANGEAFFDSGAEQDARDSSRVIAAIGAGGIGLPDRDYYVKSDAKSVEIRTRYVAHITRMLQLAGESQLEAATHALIVMRIESALATASLTQVEKRDPYRTYHRETLRTLEKLWPHFDWRAYFGAMQLNPLPWLDVNEPRFLTEFDARLADESLTDLKAYLRWALIRTAAPDLNGVLVTESFAFNSGYLRGVEHQRPRWRRCVAMVDGQLGEALGKEFVARVFPASVKARTVRMTEQIEAAMKARIQALDWMTAQTKSQALAKLAAMRNKIGYPQVWRDYSAIRIERGDFFGNVTRAEQFESRRDAAKIGKPVDRAEWGMTPPTVNAYYDSHMNDINFPAGVLLPPLFDPKLDDAPNYGNTGATIGHELTHGFDDEGRQYDGAGNLRDWWKAGDARQFEQRAQCIHAQYSQYTIVDDIKINGALTSGEDIADLGGELLAWMAWQEQTRNMQLESRDGLTPEQRFFVGFAQWSCTNDRPQSLRVNAVVDPHSPAQARINGVVSNMPQFAEAFQCKAGSPLVRKPAALCRVW